MKTTANTSSKLIAALLLAAFLVGCNIQPQNAQVDDDHDYRQQTSVVSQNQDGITQQNEPTEREDSEDDMRAKARLPDDFPIPVPEDYEVREVRTSKNETTAVLEAPSGEDAYNYYRQALSDAGIRFVDERRNQSGPFDAELEFSSSDVEGNLEFEGNTIEIDVENYT